MLHTGEEPYSLAILLREMLFDFQDWRIHLIATDINTAAIAWARGGLLSQLVLTTN